MTMIVPLAEVWFFDVFSDFHAFVTMAIATFAIIGGLGSRSMAIGAVSAYLLFTQYAISAEDTLLLNTLYVTLVLVVLGMGFKLWRLEGAGTGGSGS